MLHDPIPRLQQYFGSQHVSTVNASKNPAFSSYKPAQLSRGNSISHQHKTRFFVLSSHCILLWAYYRPDIRVHFTSPFTIYGRNMNLKMSMYSLFFANCSCPVNSINFKIYGNAFKSLDLLIDEKSPKIHERKLISTSFPVACDSQFSCQCVFKCAEINSASAVKYNCLILLLELHIGLQLSLNTSVLILLSFCRHFLTISHMGKDTACCEGLKPLSSQMSRYEKQLYFLKDLVPLVPSLELPRRQNKIKKTVLEALKYISHVEGRTKRGRRYGEALSRFFFIPWAFVCLCLDFSVG